MSLVLLVEESLVTHMTKTLYNATEKTVSIIGVCIQALLYAWNISWYVDINFCNGSISVKPWITQFCAEMTITQNIQHDFFFFRPFYLTMNYLKIIMLYCSIFAFKLPNSRIYSSQCETCSLHPAFEITCQSWIRKYHNSTSKLSLLLLSPLTVL
jgi:hypothetical protein